MQSQNRIVEMRLPLIENKMQRPDSWVETHNEAIRCARTLKRAYGELLKVLIEVERREIFYQFEKTSLYSYCVDILELPKHTAYDFIDVVRTAKTIPALAEAVIEGRTSISKARRVCSVITEKNQKEWIGLVCECSQSIVQRCVAMANPRAAVSESLNYVSSDVLEIKFAVSEEWAGLLKETKDLLSTRERRAVSTEEALFILMADNKKRNDPVAKAERAQRRSDKRLTTISHPDTKLSSADEPRNARADDNNSMAAPSEALPKRDSNSNERNRYIPSAIEHAVTLRDLNQCTYVDARGERCSSKRWLEKHHIVEFSRGGSHTLGNLETLCSAHHKMKHRNQGNH